jgi:hypothetical protein
MHRGARTLRPSRVSRHEPGTAGCFSSDRAFDAPQLFRPQRTVGDQPRDTRVASLRARRSRRWSMRRATPARRSTRLPTSTATRRADSAALIPSHFNTVMTGTIRIGG